MHEKAYYTIDLTLFFSTISNTQLILYRGRVAEWPIAAVLKTVRPKGLGGSNPSPSAIVANENTPSNT